LGTGAWADVDRAWRFGFEDLVVLDPVGIEHDDYVVFEVGVAVDHEPAGLPSDIVHRG